MFQFSLTHLWATGSRHVLAVLASIDGIHPGRYPDEDGGDGDCIVRNEIDEWGERGISFLYHSGVVALHHPGITSPSLS
jgi:hypothetical protein